MKAVVMAGGAGTRLRPITIERPKPMITVVSKPALGHILDLLKQHGITEVIITVQYLANMIQDYFGDGTNLGMKLSYRVEEAPLGTAGGVKNVQDFLDDTFLVVSGDAITDFDLNQIIRFHEQKTAKATIVLYRVPNPLEYGVIVTDPDGYVSQLLEKPTWGEVISDTVNTGIYVLEPEILDMIPAGEPYDFATQLFPKILRNKQPLAGYVADGYWCDIGNAASLRQSTFDLLEGRVSGIDLGTPIGNNVYVGKDVEIAPTAILTGPIYLGNAVKVKDHAVITGPAVIRDYSIIDERAQIVRSIIWRNCFIGKAVELRGAMILRHCSFKSKSVAYEGAVIGDGSIVGEDAVIHTNVKIWPGKEIEPGATIKNSVIWGSQGRRVLFGRSGVTGMVNVDFTPEFSAKLGAAFGATLPKNAVVTFNRDLHRSSRMLKRSAIAGLPSAGVDVADLGVQPIPVARYFTRVSGASAGMHVRLATFDKMEVHILFFDEQGLNLAKNAQRGVERIFFREDFRRVYMDEIGTINYADLVQETYTDGFMKAINPQAIRAVGFNLVIDYANGPAINLLPGLFDQLGCETVVLNARPDEGKMSISYENFSYGLERLEAITAALKADLGIRLDVGGEQIFVVDDNGVRLSGVQLSAAMAELALSAQPGKTVAITADLPLAFEKIAARHQGKILRTRVDPYALMDASMDPDVVLAVDGDGHFVFPTFQPAIDGLMAIANLLEFLAVQERTLSDVLADLPAYFLAGSRVYCAWEIKGAVMRQLAQQFAGKLVPSVEGAKMVFGDGAWVMVLPHQDQPHIEVVAEAASQADADRLVDEYSRLIKSLQFP